MQIQEMKQRVDLHDLAGRLGLERPGGRGNYRSPHHQDKNPSLSIWEGKDGAWRWKDHSDASLGGDLFDLVQYVEGCDKPAAIQRVRSLYGFASEQRAITPARPSSKIEYIAQQCLRAPQQALPYLVDTRGLEPEAITRAIQRRTLGFSDWTSSERQPGEEGYGGPAAAFICQQRHTGEALGVDYRYIAPELNGGLKTKSQGEKHGLLWTSCREALRRAHTVVIVESAVNALTVDSAAVRTGLLAGWAAVATRGTGNQDIDWSFMVGKRAVICMDNDEPDKNGRRPGPEAAWKLLDSLTAMNVPAMLVDQGSEAWDGINDLNDFYRAHGATTTRVALETLEEWLIPGVDGGGGVALGHRIDGGRAGRAPARRGAR